MCEIWAWVCVRVMKILSNLGIERESRLTSLQKNIIIER